MGVPQWLQKFPAAGLPQPGHLMDLAFMVAPYHGIMRCDEVRWSTGSKRRWGESSWNGFRKLSLAPLIHYLQKNAPNRGRFSRNRQK
jgi:hypothetical protein